MKIQLLKAWHRKPPGTVFDPPDGVANVLIRRHFAVEVKPFKPRQSKQQETAREPLR